MGLTYTPGDLLDSGIETIAHGCSCYGAMGPGVAPRFKSKWPEMYEQYKIMCRNGRFHPGDVYVYKATDRIILNLGTQRRTKASLPALSQAIRRASSWAVSHGIHTIGIPRIGTGLDWDRQVEPAILSAIDGLDIELLVFEQPERAAH